jgi:hypothetical protein
MAENQTDSSDGFQKHREILEDILGVRPVEELYLAELAQMNTMYVRSSEAKLHTLRLKMHVHPEFSIDHHIAYLQKFRDEATYGPKRSCDDCRYRFNNTSWDYSDGFGLPPLNEDQNLKFEELYGQQLKAFEAEDFASQPKDHCLLGNVNDYEANGLLCPKYISNGRGGGIYNMLLPVVERKLSALEEQLKTSKPDNFAPGER